MERWSVLALTTLLATCSWFFVSTGWLGYFDSWLILSLLVVTFTRPWLWTVITVLIAPCS